MEPDSTQVINGPNAYFWYALAIALSGIIITFVLMWGKWVIARFDRQDTTLDKLADIVGDLKTILKVHDLEIQNLKNKKRV